MKFRCSGLGNLMVEPKLKSETLSETTKTYLREKYIYEKYNRSKFVESKYMTKGTEVEEESLTLLSIVTRKLYNKNEKLLWNDWIAGTPDTYEGDTIENAITIIDIKSSWDIFTFFASKEEKLNKMYYWQLQGYMWLTGAKVAQLAYCLINTPTKLVDDEIRKLSYKFMSDEELKLAEENIIKNASYNDLSYEEKIQTITIDRNDDDIEKLKLKIEECRKYISKKYGYES
jgi:hypothetical protein